MENSYSSTIESATATELTEARAACLDKPRVVLVFDQYQKYSTPPTVTTITTFLNYIMDSSNFDGDEAAEFLNGRMKQMLGDKYDKVIISIIIIICIIYVEILYIPVCRK